MSQSSNPYGRCCATPFPYCRYLVDDSAKVCVVPDSTRSIIHAFFVEESEPQVAEAHHQLVPQVTKGRPREEIKSCGHIQTDGGQAKTWEDLPRPPGLLLSTDKETERKKIRMILLHVYDLCTGSAHRGESVIKSIYDTPQNSSLKCGQISRFRPSHIETRSASRNPPNLSPCSSAVFSRTLRTAMGSTRVS